MNLISKKDLLAITGISYGQLYRWKRERLIPEEWFIKQSAYTGQETFFPREQILSRVQSILDLKDKYSLDELAKILSPGTSSSKISVKDLDQIDEIDKELLKLIPQIYQKEELDFYEVALAAAISKVSKKIGLPADQSGDLLRRSIAAASGQKNVNSSCTIFAAGKDYHTVFSPNLAPMEFDDDIEAEEPIHLSEIADKIKIKYKSWFV